MSKLLNRNKKVIPQLNYLLVILFTLFLNLQNVHGTVVITPATGGGAICSGNYSNLGNIVITEGSSGDIPAASNATLILTAPTGYNFNPGVGTVGFLASKNITATSILVTTSTITITYSCALVTLVDVITVSGIQVIATVPAPIAASGSIFRTSANPGTGVITGITPDVTNFGTLTQVAQMTYVSSTTTSVAGTVAQASSNNAIIGIQVVTTGSCGAVNLNQFNFDVNGGNGTGTDNPASDIINAKIYYTGTSSTFSPVSQYGSVVVSPTGTFTVSGSQVMQSGTNYFWLSYDVTPTAVVGDRLDAQCTQLTFGGSIGVQIPTITNPVGNRTIGASSIFTVGSSRAYPSIQAAYNALPAPITSNCIIEVYSDYAPAGEPYPDNFIDKSSGSYTITIRPALGVTGLVCKGDPGANLYLFNYNGAKSIIFDGRPGGAGAVGDFLIRKLTTVGGAFSLTNDASANELKFLTIEADASATTGMLLFGTTTGSTGNSNNNIHNCVFQDVTVANSGTAAIPLLGISSVGTAAKTNKSNIVDNCKFIDIYNPGSSVIGLGANTDNWFITNNHFYQTAGYASALSTTFSVINITSGGGYTIAGNYIGGSAPSCGGAAYTITPSTGVADWNAIKFGAATAGANNAISNNTISNIFYKVTVGATANPLNGIVVAGTSNYTVGYNSGGNTIGSTATNGSITLTQNAASSGLGFRGIVNSSTGNVSIAYNTIAGISLLTGSASNIATQATMISNTAGSTVVDNNTFGGSLASSIFTASAFLDNNLFGVLNTAVNGITVTNNTFQNITHGASTEAYSMINSTAGPLVVIGNNFNAISSTSLSNVGSNGRSTMISHWGGTVTTATINSNTFQNIAMTNTGAASLYFIEMSMTSPCTVNGNTFGGSTANNISLAGNNWQMIVDKVQTGSMVANNNIIQNITLTSGGSGTAFFGISTNGGPLTSMGNTVQNISINTTYVVAQAYAAISAGGSGCLISNNIINNIKYTNATTTNTMNQAIYLSGGGVFSKNMITQISNASTSATAKVVGIEVSSGSWDCSNNVVLIDNNGLSNAVPVYGIEIASTGTINILQNTIKLSGSATGGAVNTSALYRTAAGVHTIKNNIFQNLRTGGTGAHFAEYKTGAGTYTTNFNYLETSNPAALCYWMVGNNTLAAWQTNSSASNSITGTTTIDVNGYAQLPFAGASTGTNLTGSVPDDKNGVIRPITPWMGAYEGPAILTSVISPLLYCQGATVNVAYTVTGSYVGGNIFTAQLSDATGSFATPVSIGTFTSTLAGTITATIPGAQAAGTNYRIRVVSSNPLVIGSDNGANITINAKPVAPTASATVQPTCAIPTGTIVVTAPVGAYDYSIGGAYQTGLNFTGVAPATSFSVTARLTANTTCISTITNVTVNAVPAVPAVPTASTTLQPTCALPTGTIAILAPIGSFQYSMDGGTYQAGTTFSATPVGNHTFTTRSNADNTCISAASANVVVNAVPAVPAIPTASTTVQPTCALPTGTIAISAPIGSFQYSMDGGTYQGSTSFSSAPVGNHTFTTRSSADTTCISAASANVVVNAVPAVPAIPTASTTVQPTCALSTGTIVISAPIGSFQYNMDGGTYQAGTTFSATPVGNHTFTTRSNADNTCISAASANVVVNAVPAVPAIPTASATVQPTCAVPTGTIDISAPLGSFDYSMDGGTYQLSTSFTTVSVGAHTFTARSTSDNTCVSAASPSISITAPVVPAVPTASTTVQPTCALPTGTMVISAPIGSFQYSMDGGTYQTGTSFSGATVGNHTFTTRSNADNTCISTASANVVVNAVPVVPAIPTASATVQPTCAVPTGTIDISAPLGSFDYSIDGGAYQLSTTFTTLSVGAHTFTARSTSDNTCISAASVNIVINTVPTVPAIPTASTTVQPTCALSTGTIVISAPIGSFQYNMDGGTYQAGTTFSGAPVGNHTFTTRSNADNTCISAASANVVVNAVPAVPAVPTVAVTTSATCAVPTGTIDISAPLGSFDYSMDGGAYQLSTTFTTVSVGGHTFTARSTSDNTCVSAATPSVAITAPAVPPIPTAAVTTSATCAVPTGTIDISAPLGSFDYSMDGGTYQLSTSFTTVSVGAHTFTARSTSDNTCVSAASPSISITAPVVPAVPTASTTVQPTCALPTGTMVISAPIGSFQYSMDGGTYQTGTSFSGATVGNHTFTTRSNADNTCISTASANVVVNAVPVVPAIPTASATVQPTCAVPTGTIDISAPLGSFDYSIDGGAYQLSTTFTTLSVGAHTFKARSTSDNTCISAASVNIVINTVPTVPAIPTASTTVQAICATPTGTIDISAPIGSFDYSMDGGAYQLSTSFTTVSVGAHTFTARSTSDNTCISAATPSVAITAPAVPAIPTAAVTTPATCAVPTGTIDISAPIGSFDYSMDGGTYQLSTSFTNVPVGGHIFTARSTSDNTCVSAASSSVSITAPAVPSVPTAVVTIPATCVTSTGTIDISAPIGSFDYSMDGGTYQLSTSFTTVPVGGHTFTARSTSDNTCVSVASSSISIVVPVIPTVVITNPSTICAPATIDLTSTAITTGSTSGLVYTQWADAAATVALSTPNSVTGSATYYIKGTNASLCFDIQPVVVVIHLAPAIPLITISLPALCNPDYSVLSVPNSYSTYEWHYGSTASFSSASQLVNAGTNNDTAYVPGYYFVKVFNASGCSVNSAGTFIDYAAGAVPALVQTSTTGKETDLDCTTTSTYYQWYVKTVSGKLKYIPGANTKNFTAYFDGDYYVATKFNNCYLYSNVRTVSGMVSGSVLKQGFVETDSSIVVPEIFFTGDIEVFPNPNNGIFEVHYLSNSNEISTVSLYNFLGEIMEQQTAGHSGFISMNFSDSGLSNGVYFVEVKQQGKAVRKKIVILY